MLADAASSHRSWFGRGRERVDLDGVTLFLGEHDAVLAFPDSTGDLETAVGIARDAGAREIGCWSLLPDEALGRRLLQLGFQDGWQPHWMGLDPRRAEREPEREVEETTHCSRELPYASAEHESVLGGDVHHFVVRDERRSTGTWCSTSTAWWQGSTTWASCRAPADVGLAVRSRWPPFRARRRPAAQA